MPRFDLDELGELSIEEQIESINELAKEKISPKYNHLRDSNFNVTETLKPLFDYQYLNINTIPDYCFCKNSIPIDVYWAYFNEVKRYSNMTIKQLTKIKHFTLSYKVSHTELQIYKILVLGDENIRLNNAQKPTMGHFPLWTSKEKSPRVFFLVGRMGILNILLLDYEHKIHEMKV